MWWPRTLSWWWLRAGRRSALRGCLSWLTWSLDCVPSGRRAMWRLSSGLRRESRADYAGTDRLAALSLGADFVLVGRAYLDGLMAGGEHGARRALQILEEDARPTLQLLGAASVAELTSEHVSLGAEPATGCEKRGLGGELSAATCRRIL